MLKIFSLFSLFAVVACGKVGEEVNAVGGVRSVEQVFVSASEKSELSSICEALENKATIYSNSYLNSYSQFNFSVNYKGCTGSSASNVVAARLINSGNVLTYSVISGSNFQTTPETNNSGLISQVCQALNDNSNLFQPILKGPSAIWFRSYNGDSGCTNVNTTKCFQMEIGYKQSNGSYIVMSKDVFAISKVNDMSIGRVLRHERFDKSFCAGDNEQIEYSSVLNSITN
jgi:hypothetical protein